MFEQIDIDDLLGEVAKFRSHIGQVHSRLTHPQERELLGEVIAKIDESRSQVKQQFTTAVDAMEKGLDQATSAAKANLAKTAQLRAELAERIKAEAEAAPAEPPKPEAPAFDFHLGARLSEEMLGQFADQTERLPAEKISDREIWQDWSWSASD